MIASLLFNGINSIFSVLQTFAENDSLPNQFITTNIRKQTSHALQFHCERKLERDRKINANATGLSDKL